jgi:LacI family transcriptional regulator
LILSRRHRYYGDMASLKHVTLVQVAKASGFSVGTVSLALRNSPLLLEETKKTITALAEKLGYHPNPRVSALMAHIRRSRKVHEGERLAFVWLEATEEETKGGLFLEYLKGARARAEQLGYALEQFRLNTPKMTTERLERILVARGIVGVVLSPMLHAAHFKLSWNWQNFAAAVIGNASCHPDLHRAGFNHYLAIRALLQQIAQRGHVLAAAVFSREADERAKRALSAAFIANHPAGPAKAAALIFFVERAPTELPSSWLTRCRADALITHADYYQSWQKTGHAPALPEIFLIDATPGGPSCAGIDQGEAVIAASAVDLVVAQLLRNERGAPLDAQALLFAGHWREVRPPTSAG